MKAAQLLYGDNVGGAIVPEEDGDILMKLAREALESADLPDLQSLFADEVVVSNSPLGCPTAPSVPLPVLDVPKVVSWADWMTQRGAAGRSANRSRSKQADAKSSLAVLNRHQPGCQSPGWCILFRRITMEGKPRCKKCGRVLKSPASIARGMGSKCAGDICNIWKKCSCQN